MLEKALADMEGLAKHAFDNVLAAPGQVPGLGDQIAIVTFIAFQVVRGSAFRAIYNKLRDYAWREFELTAHSRSREELREQIKNRHGVDPSETDLDRLLEMIGHPERFAIEPHQNESIKAALSAVPEVFEVLLPRTWNMVRFDEPVLVISDEPVSRWSKPRPPDPFWTGGGIADCDEVRLPVDPNHMLVLTLNRKPFDPGVFLTAASDWARNMNYPTIQHGHRWVLAHPDHPRLDLVDEIARTAPRRGVTVGYAGHTTELVPGEQSG